MGINSDEKKLIIWKRDFDDIITVFYKEEEHIVQQLEAEVERKAKECDIDLENIGEYEWKVTVEFKMGRKK